MAFVLFNVMHVLLLGGLDAPFAFLTVLHVGVWVLTFVYDRYLHYHHHHLRRAGYLSLYMKTKEIRKIPFMVFSIGIYITLFLVVLYLKTFRFWNFYIFQHKQKFWKSYILITLVKNKKNFFSGNTVLLLVVSFQASSGRRNLMLIFQITLSVEVFLVMISTLIYLGKFFMFFCSMVVLFYELLKRMTPKMIVWVQSSIKLCEYM